MAKKKAQPKQDEKSNRKRPAKDLEARERELISLSMDLAEKRLREGTATSMEIVHFLKLGSTREQMEQDLLERKTENLVAKTESLYAEQHMEEVYAKAIEALRSYNGSGAEEEL